MSVSVKVGRVHVRRGEGPLRALCSITLAGAFAVHGLRVIEGRNGLFVQFPQEKGRDGNWRDICHPVVGELRHAIQEAVLQAYQQLAAGQSGVVSG